MNQELIDIIESVKVKIADGSDMAWTHSDNPKQLRDELDYYLQQLSVGDTSCIENLNSLFLPTATLQEHSNGNGWADEYLVLAEKFDRLYHVIKQ